MNDNIKNIGVRFGEGQPTDRGGRPKTRALKELLEDLEENQDGTFIVPLKDCIIDKEKGRVSIKLPTKEQIAITLMQKALKDVRWFQEYAKLMGEYEKGKGKEIKVGLASLEDDEEYI